MLSFTRHLPSLANAAMRCGEQSLSGYRYHTLSRVPERGFILR
jgi:hypothetical protein